jgi:phage tail sheath protein FI
LRSVEKAVDWLTELRSLIFDDRFQRAAAVYHPRVTVPDPLGGLKTLRSIPASGHVAGVISRLDRERGAHHTPANALVYEALDVSNRFDEAAQSLLYQQGINLLRCSPGRGIQLWGGRTLNVTGTGRFVAHRRLIHRLVRAIRRVAEPLVFHTNGPELWFTFVRSITTVLLEAYRAGGLKGARPEEAFVVRCDEKTNPPEEVDNGRLLCEIELAPATPMEFITLRIALSADATLEVFEA